MSKLHPWNRYVHLKAGEEVRVSGSVDLHWPISKHSTVQGTARCTVLDVVRIEARMEGVLGRASFSWEESEPAPGTAVPNTFHAQGALGGLKFSFDDEQVEYAEKSPQILEIVADGTLEVSGPIDPQTRVTLRVWKVGEGVTRLRFVAVRKNGKPLAEGDLTLGGAG